MEIDLTGDSLADSQQESIAEFELSLVDFSGIKCSQFES